MSRVEDTKTFELWNLSEEVYLYMLSTEGILPSLVKYYEMGIKMMTAANRDLVSTRRYSDLSKEDLVLISKRNKTIDFYEKRLKELKR